MGIDRPLKHVSNDKIENAISKALYELTNTEYVVSIRSINYHPNGFSSTIGDEHDVTISIVARREDPFGNTDDK